MLGEIDNDDDDDDDEGNLGCSSFICTSVLA